MMRKQLVGDTKESENQPFGSNHSFLRPSTTTKCAQMNVYKDQTISHIRRDEMELDFRALFIRQSTWNCDAILTPVESQVLKTFEFEPVRLSSLGA